MDYVEIGKNIKRFRKGKMTQRELAREIGKTESSIRKYEKGLVEIPLRVIHDIADVLNVDMLYLLGQEYFDSLPDYQKHIEEPLGLFYFLDSLGFSVSQTEEKCEEPFILSYIGYSATFSEIELTVMTYEAKNVIDEIFFKKARKKE